MKVKRAVDEEKESLHEKNVRNHKEN